MAYDEVLAHRISELLADVPGVVSKKMFGGLGYMVNGHMAVAANSKGGLMVRADPATGEAWVSETVQPMEMGGREMHGWLVVDIEAVSSDEDLQLWVDRGVDYVATLPPK